jgi:hypothetical protein
VERHYSDGRKEITFPNKTRKTIYPDQYEVMTVLVLQQLNRLAVIAVYVLRRAVNDLQLT